MLHTPDTYGMLATQHPLILPRGYLTFGNIPRDWRSSGKVVLVVVVEFRLGVEIDLTCDGIQKGLSVLKMGYTEIVL